jgi:hypothetical protein
MPFPMVLSPYLRPLREAEGISIDNGITARRFRPGPLDLRVVRALWSADEAERELATLAAEVGEEDLLAALSRLVAEGLVFPDLESCDAVFDQVLEASKPPVPFIDQVELTNRCPMRCRFCPRGVEGRVTRPTGLMDLGLFTRLLDQLHPAQAAYRPLELHHLGESLLHPEVHRFVEEATRRGLPTELSVNPSLLTPERARRLLDAGLGRLVISLDGMDEATLGELRGPAASFAAAEANLDRLLAMVAAQRDPPRVVIQMLDLARNKGQRERFVERWGATGLPTVTAYVKDLDGDDPDTGAPSTSPLSHLCCYPFRSVVVLWDGRVVPCCRDADAAVVLGDLATSELRSIWDGPAAAQLRAMHLARAGGAARGLPAGHLCDGCAWRRARFAASMAYRHPDLARPDPLAW